MSKKKKRRQTIKIIRHKKNCYAVKNVKEGLWNTVWAYPDRGWRKGKMFIVYLCNNKDCNAKLFIENEYLIRRANLPNGTYPIAQGLIVDVKFVYESQFKLDKQN